jgi:hypothetical protein
MGNVDAFYDYLEYLTAIWYNWTKKNLATLDSLTVLGNWQTAVRG